jgi:hypothetical protein
MTRCGVALEARARDGGGEERLEGLEVEDVTFFLDTS